MGALTDVVKRTIPSSYRAMVGPSDVSSSYYSLSQLQKLADYVQMRLMATVAGATLEATTYDIVLQEFLGKVTTLRFIPAAIDYWMDQYEQQNLTGSNETVSFAARLAHLQEVQRELAAWVDAEFAALAPIYGFTITTKGHKPGVSYGDNGRDLLLTPDPQDWPAQDDSTSSSTASPWEW